MFDVSGFNMLTLRIGPFGFFFNYLLCWFFRKQLERPWCFFSVKVSPTIFFQNPKTVNAKKIWFLKKWLKWLKFCILCKISQTSDSLDLPLPCPKYKKRVFCSKIDTWSRSLILIQKHLKFRFLGIFRNFGRYKQTSIPKFSFFFCYGKPPSLTARKSSSLFSCKIKVVVCQKNLECSNICEYRLFS